MSIMATFVRYNFLHYNQPVYSDDLYITDILIGLVNSKFSCIGLAILLIYIPTRPHGNHSGTSYVN